MTRNILLLVFALTASASAQVLGPYSGAINISGDLTAVADDRPTTWGGSTSYASTIQFAEVPVGDRVHVLRIYGDFIAFCKGLITAGQTAEVGWGLKTTAPDGSARITYPGYQATGYDNSFVWRQDVLTSTDQKVSFHFDYDVSVGGILAADNILISQMFVALDTTSLPIHEEATFVVVYRYEPVVAIPPHLSIGPLGIYNDLLPDWVVGGWYRDATQEMHQ